MEKIRKGNDITVLWKIYAVSGGTERPYDLSGRNLTLYLRSPFGKEKVQSYSIEANTIRFTFYGKDQSHIGKYSLTLVENEGVEGMHTLDECDAFELVSCSCKACGEPESKVEMIILGLKGTMTMAAGMVEIDDYLSTTSKNAVQNKVITAALEKKAEQSAVPTKTSQLKNDSSFITKNEVPDPDWNASTYKEGHIKNRTHHMQDHMCHYFKGSPIKVSKPNGTGYVLLTYDTDLADKFIRIDIKADESKTHEFLDAMGMPLIFSWDAGNSTINVESFAGAVETYGMRAYYSSSAKSFDEYFVTLDDGFIPESVARKSEIATINGKSITKGGNIVIEGKNYDNEIAELERAKLEGEKVGATSPTEGTVGDSYDDTEIKNKLTELSERIDDIGEGPQGPQGPQGNSGYQGAAGELEIVNNLTQGGATAALSAEMGKVLSEEVGAHFGAKLPYRGAAYTSFPCRLYPGMTIVSMGVSTAVYLKTKDGKSFNVYSVPYTIEEDIVAFQVNTTSEGTLIITGDYDVLKKDVASLSEKVADYDEVKEQVADTSMHFGENEMPYGGSAYTNIPCSLSKGMVIVSGGAASAVYLKTKDGKTINVYAFPYVIESDIVAFQVNTTASGVLTIKGDYDGLKNKVSAIENKVSDLEKQGGHPNIPYMEFGGNLFDCRDTQILSNHYIAGDGTIREINGWSVSGYIAIETNKTYVFKCYPGFFGTSSVKNISSYASDKTFLTTIVGTLKDNYLVIANTNKEAKYVRVTINSPDIESFMFVEGDVYPSERKRYDWIPNKYFNQSPVNALYGKIALFDGDSIAAGTEDTVLCGWSKIVGDKNSMDWHSIAVSGGTITNGVYHNGALKHPICLGVETFYSQGIHDPDYIIFEGGSNDELLGDFRDPENLPERFGVFNEADFTGPFDNSTFCGALDYLFFKAQSLYPKTKFGFIIAQKMGKSSVGYTAKTHNRRAIFDYIIRSCRKWGIPYIDLWEEGWLNPSIQQHYDSNLDKSGNIAAGSLYTDGQHLTASGYQLISSKIEGWMKTL